MTQLAIYVPLIFLVNFVSLLLVTPDDLAVTGSQWRDLLDLCAGHSRSVSLLLLYKVVVV